MCDLTPFGLKCKRDKCPHSVACYVHHFNAAIMRLCQRIPIFGDGFRDYCCPDFQAKSVAELVGAIDTAMRAAGAELRGIVNDMSDE